MNNSYWIDSTKDLDMSLNSLNEDVETDVCIIGAGITGVSTAYALIKSGLKVAVVDRAPTVCNRTTSNTTAKITCMHGLFYKYLIDSFSIDFAKQYLYANQEAISNIKSIIEKENIDCDFEVTDNCIFTETLDEVQKIKDEVTSLNSLGINSEFVTEIDLPFEVLGGMKLKEQAQFHPRKYVLGLCKSILENGGQIYVNTKVVDVKQSNGKHITYTENNKITSKYVVLASHYPIINFPGFYFLKMYQESSYIIAIDTKEDISLNGMYISSEEPTLSFRTAKYNDKHLLLIGGSNHKVGQNENVDNSYEFLEETAKNLYPNSEVLYRWSTQDCISLDKVPYIGEFSSTIPNMYVATGFKKWGMSTSNVAANIIKDMIIGNKNKYAEVFNSTRFHPLKNHEEMGSQLKQTVKSLVVDKIKISDRTISELENNEGKIVELDGEKVGVFKKGKNIYAVKPFCSHLGCELSFNNLDKTWDCPCHGSRFTYKGKSINDPSIKDLDII